MTASADLGYAGLDSTGKIVAGELGTGIADGTTFLRGDRAWAVPAGGGGGDAITINGVALVDADFDDATPAAPAGGVNVVWQKDAGSPANVSAAVPANGVSNTVLRDSAGFSVVGKATTGTGDPADIVAADETVLGRTAAGNLAFAQIATGQIATAAVTYAKVQDVSATDKVLGRSTAGAGDVEEIACTAAGRALIDDADAGAQRTTLGLGALAVLGSVNDGNWSGADLAVANGGTGTSTAQAAIDTLSAVAGATNEHVLTKDTATGNAIFKVVPGGGAAATQAEQEAGASITAFTSPGRQHFHPSAAKFWVVWTGNSTTILTSYNMTSIADTAVGDADGTIATDFSGANWCGQCSTLESGTDGWDADSIQSSGFNARAAGTFGVLCGFIIDGGTAAASLTDPVDWNVCGFGDHA